MAIVTDVCIPNASNCRGSPTKGWKIPKSSSLPVRQFNDEDMIPLCPPSEFPWLRDSKGWSGEVTCFYCPITEFAYNESMELLECEVFPRLQIDRFWKTQVKISARVPESSGGAVVLKSNGCLIGILIKEVPYGELVLTSVSPASDRPDAEIQIEMSEDTEAFNVSKDDGVFSSVSTSIHYVTKSAGTTNSAVHTCSILC